MVCGGCVCRRGHQDEVLGDALARRLGVHAMAERHEGGGPPAGGYTASVQENREYIHPSLFSSIFIPRGKVCDEQIL